MSLIELKHVSRVFGEGEETKTVALQNVDLEIQAGEFVAVMGPSGSGKSTLLHIMGLLDRQSGGNYQFEGVDTGSLGDEDLAGIRNEKMGFVFQAFHLLARANVLENVKLPLYYSSIPQREYEERARAAIEQVGLSHRIEHEPSQLSGGEKQRVAIARALVREPKVIFADEPTGNLDSQTGALVMELIDSLHERGHTIVVITHETPVANFAQRVIEMKDGAIASDVKSGRRGHGYAK